MSTRIKNILLSIGIVLLLVGVVNLAVPYVVDAKKQQAEIQASLKNAYGLEVKMDAAPAVTTYPSPKIYFKNVTVQDAAGTEVLSAPSIVVQLGWLGLTGQRPALVTLTQPRFSISKEGLAAFVARLSTGFENSNTLPESIQIDAGSMDVAAAKTAEGAAQKTPVSLQQIAARLQLPAGTEPFSVDGSLQFHGQSASFSANYQTAGDHKAALNLRISDKAEIKLAGSITPGEQWKWDGTTSANVKDMAGFIAFFTETAAPAQPTESTKTPISLMFEGSARADSEGLTLSRTEATIENQKGGFAAYVGWQKNYSLAFEISTENLALDAWYQALAPELLSQTQSQGIGVSPLITSPLSENLAIYLILNAESATYNKRNFKKFQLAAELDGGAVVVHKAEALMPGESTIRMQGKIIQQPEGQRFSGTASLSGQHFNEWLADMEPSAKSLPAEDFSDFSLAGNLFISKEQLRLSEALLRIHEFELAGGFATYFEATPRMEAEVKFQNANLDYFRNIWRENKTADATGYELLMGSSSAFDWLKKLPATMDFTLAIQGFTFLDAAGDYASMRIYMTPGELNLYGIDLRYPDNSVNGNVKFNVAGARPRLDVTLSSQKFNTDYFKTTDAGKPYYNPSNPEQRFSEELFDMRWMSALDAGIDISLGEIMHEGSSYSNFKWKAEMKDANMTIQKLGFAYLNGTFDITGTLIGGKVPGLAASFALYNVDLPELMRRYFNIESINKGNVSITGAVATSGINMKTWLEQSEIKFNVSARGVRAANFNLQSVIDTTSQARSTTDVAQGVNNNLYSSSTDLSVDGSVNMIAGVMKTPGIRLSYGSVLGNLTGEVSLKPWTLNLSTLWQFPELSSSTVPTMTTNMQGDINQYTTRVDTSSLEAFVAKRIVGQ